MEIKKQFHNGIGIFSPPKVGKTVIVNQLIHKKFTKRYIPTTENNIEYITSYGDSTYICLLTDTCGSNDFPAMRRLTIVKCNSLIIVFALDSYDTFLKGRKIIYDIIEQKPSEVFHMVLVGNKKENGKCINMEKIHNLCDEIKGRTERITICFMEVSPKDNDDVSNTFHMVLDLFPRKEKFQRRNSFTKGIPCRRKSMVFENENTFGSSCYLTISPSFISLNELSSGEDTAKSNFKIIPDFN